jgi:O-methyltransferase involved in polyketide biosynthesis
MWDFYLGGKDNFAADRKAAELLNQACQRVGAPTGAEVAQENRTFLGRAVTYLASRGIDQFIDLGAGLPTRRNVHEIAQAVNPTARTVYGDYDPLVVSHGRALLADTPQTIMIRADIRSAAVLDDPALRDHLDLRRPVAVLMIAVLHLLPDDEQPAKIVAEIRDRLAPGSTLALTHVSSDSRPSAATVVAAEFTRLGVTTPLVPRTYAEVSRFFDGWDLVEPGLVFPARWQPTPHDPDPGPDTRWMYAGVARLPAH